MRLVRLTIACVMLGFITTVAVAWAIAACVPLRLLGSMTITQKMTPSADITLMELRADGVTWRRCAVSGLKIPLDDFRSSEFWRNADEMGNSDWGNAPALLRSDFPIPQLSSESATGWPKRAVWYAVYRDRIGGRDVLEGGIPLGRLVRVNTFDMTHHPALPLRPIWLGLLVNTAFYTASWFIPLGGVGLMRRWRRRRRGQCPRCAYDLAGLTPGQPCPECGQARSSARVESHQADTPC